GVKTEAQGFPSLVQEPNVDLSNEAMLNGVKYYVSLISSFE
ncbi:amidohydrolase, partial [Francisella tularensis subsp. holarctica]|nr:amidohydrolase [Francisella tularensis subsp. holarctica]